jgi:hypothetical protein
MSRTNKSIAESESDLSARPNKALFTPPVSSKQGHKASASGRDALKHIMTLHLVTILLLSMVLVSAAYAQQGERQNFGSEGLFSYVPPNGWKVSEFPGLKFKVCFGQPANGFAPNITVVDEASEKPLEDYVKDNIAFMQKLFQGQKILGQADFTTSDGARAVKLITERDDAQTKKSLRQIFYFFDAGGEKLVVTGSSLAEDGAALDQVFDASMKTFAVTKKPS